MIGNSWDDCLPESHREALHDALCLLVDDFLNDPDYDEPLFITALPSKYLLQYDGGFRRKFLVILFNSWLQTGSARTASSTLFLYSRGIGLTCAN